MEREYGWRWLSSGSGGVFPAPAIADDRVGRGKKSRKEEGKSQGRNNFSCRFFSFVVS